MKKLLLALSTTALIFGLGACGGKKSTSTSTSSSGTSGTSSQTSQTSSQAGASSNSSEAGSSDTIYCKMEYGWWTADGAAIAIYVWGDGDSKPVAWPGQRMTLVSGETDVWSFEADASFRASYPNLIFVRVNGSGDISDWGAKTADLTFPTDGNNLYTITSSEAVWGNPGVTGAWSTYSA